MFSHKSKDNGKNKIRNSTYEQMMAVSVSIVFIFLVFVSSMLLFKNIIEEVKTLHKYNNDIVIANDIDIIMTTKENLDNDIYEKLLAITTNMEEQIKTLDLNKTKDELDKGIISEDLEKIFNDNIKGVHLSGIEDGYNNIFICTYEGIISDYSKIYAADNSEERTWDYELGKQYNNKLATNTIDKLLVQDTTTSILTLEPFKSENPNHKYVSNIDEEVLSNIYKTEGLEGLKNYYFLIPVYITKDGDIFGQDDIVSCHIVHNNKFIVVQQYNLYDYIINNDIDNKLSKEDMYVDKQFTNIENYLYILAISLILSIICVIVFLSVLSNKIFDSSDRKENHPSYSPFGRRGYDLNIDKIITLVNEANNKK